MSKFQFQTEVNQLLHLIIHSLYSHKEIFIRELISNSSDALDKLKFLTLTNENYKNLDFSPRVDIRFDFENQETLTIFDNGIGMDEKELEENLGTIARSGTKNFLENLTGDQKKDSGLIGQFGVGFYSIFMVSDKVEVITKKAGTEKAFKWVSDGKSGFEIDETEKEEFGTSVKLFLNEEGKEFASKWQIESVIKKYSNHVSFPIYIHYEDTRFEGDGDDKKEIKEIKEEQINSASALWKKNKSEIKKEDYIDFYKSITYDSDEPLHYIHTQAEGVLNYSTLFFIPKKAPFDLFRVNYTPGVKLYVKRVFITDDEKELIPTYLRFIKGVIDSDDLPLNVSREILQKNSIMAKIKSASVKKILSELQKLLTKDRDKYIEFYKEFGVPIREGLYQDYENKEKLLELVMYKSSKVDGFTSLQEYCDRMKEGQKAIYYITGKKEENLRNSPLLEMYKNKEIEVLIMDNEIDEVVVTTINKYKEFDLKSVNRANAADELKSDSDKEKEKEIQPIVDKIKKALNDKVKDVKASSRLSDSPSCIVADENDPTMRMQGILKSMGQDSLGTFKPILEINPNHEIIEKLTKTENQEVIDDISNLLLEQALLLEGVEIKNISSFVKRLNKYLKKAI